MNRHEVKNMFLSEVKQLEGTILEVGFGKPSFFEKYSDNAKIYGADFSNDVVKETKQVLTNLDKTERVKVLYSTSDKLPFHDNSFDFIVLSFCFCCLTQPKNILNEINRVAKNGGQIISFDHIRSNGFIGLLLDLSTPVYAFMHKNCHLNRNPINYYKEQSVSVLTEIKSKETFIPWLFTKCLIQK